jgi:rhodanese-related sulfurtransferase
MATVHDLTPEDVARGLTEGRILLVDVREPNETSVESYPDAVLMPLSTFDPAQLPDPEGRQVVFACRSGKRSVTASLAAQDKGFPYDSHLAGGIIGWKAAGLPTRS